MTSGVAFDVYGTARYPAADGRWLEVAAGDVRGTMALRFAFRSPSEQPTDAVACDFTLADRDGRLWTATSRFTTRVFVAHMFDLARGGEMDLVKLPEGRRRYKDVAKNNVLDRYRTAFASGLMLADARFFSDDRDYRSLLVAGRRVRIKFKYTVLSFDVATTAGPGQFTDWFVVRVAANGFWDEDRDEYLGATAFDLRCAHLLRNNTAALDEADAARGYERWRDDDLPRPLVFAPAAGDGPPQPNVRVVG